MKYDVNQYSDVEVLSTTVDKDMTLSSDSTSLIFQMFSKNIYSNPIGSIVREITSNCFDSHVEAGVESTPVIIRKNVDKLTGDISISFIDFGVGMSPERIDDVFSVLFKSTKRLDNQQIGCFGLGSKVPLAYKRSTGHGEGEYDNSYQVITIFDGIKYTYQIYDSNKCPKISEAQTEFTVEHNGTEVRIPVLERDVYIFEKEMIRQLYYFENIIFENFNNDNITNDYQIVRSKNFLFRGDEYSPYIHICLGRVAYPIDYNILNLNSNDYRMPLALRLEVGDINVIASREGIDYGESTIKILKAKLEIVKNDIKVRLAKQYDNVQSLEDYFKVKQDFGDLLFSNGKTINVGNLISKSDVCFGNFKYSDFIKMPTDKQLFEFFFHTKLYGKKPSIGRKRKWSSNNDAVLYEGSYEAILKKSVNVLYGDGDFNRKIIKHAYLKHQHQTYFIITKKEMMLANRRDIADLFNISLDYLCDDSNKPLPVVQNIIDLQEDYFEIITKHYVNYNDVVVPESFVITRKHTAITKEMRDTTISIRLYRSGGYNSRHVVKLNELFNFKEPIFYCKKEDIYKMKKAVKIFSALFDNDSIVGSYYNDKFSVNNKKKRIMFIQVGENNMKYIKFCNNAKPISEIYHSMFHRKTNVVEKYFQSYGLVEIYRGVPLLYATTGFNKVNAKWYNKAKEVKNYFDALSKPINNNGYDLDNIKNELSEYFNFNNTTESAEQLKIRGLIKDLNKLETKNESTMKYIDLPYRCEDMPVELIEILKKVMKF